MTERTTSPPSDSGDLLDSVDDAALDMLLGRLAAPPVARELPHIGDRVGEGDRYRLDEQLGRGGQGVVFLSRDLKLDRPVAVKFILPRHEEGGQTWASHCEAFDHESRLLAQLQHEQVVTIHDRGLWEDVPFLVMEYLQGETLTQLIKEHGPLRPDHAIELAIEIAQGLKAAHNIGVIHRDLKPDNIFVSPSHDRVRILDFGMAWFNPDVAQLPSSEAPLDGEVGRRHGGTASYMAPEQWKREDDQDVRTDIWAFGIILTELLTGQHPFHHENLSPKAAILTNRRNRVNVQGPNRESTEAINRLIDRCLHPDRDQRPTNILIVLRDLNAIRQYLEHGIDYTDGASPGAPPRLGALPWRGLAATVGAVLVVGLVGALIWGAEVHTDRAVFQNRVTIYAHKAGPEGPKTCFFRESRAFSVCVIGPHRRDEAFYPVTTLIYRPATP